MKSLALGTLAMVVILLVLGACDVSSRAVSEAPPSQADSPANSCAEPLLICPSEMVHIPATPNELLHIVEGRAHGFEGLSLVYSETKPGGGAPPHRHKCEEAHVVLDGKVRYSIGDKTFVAEAPFVVRIPAGVVHSFTNVSDRPIHVIGALPRSTQQEIDAE